MTAKEHIIDKLLHNQEFLNAIGEYADEVIKNSDYEFEYESKVFDHNEYFTIQLDFDYGGNEYTPSFSVYANVNWSAYLIYDSDKDDANLIGTVETREIIEILVSDECKFAKFLKEAVMAVCKKSVEKAAA